MVDLAFALDSRQLNALDDKRMKRAIVRALHKAGATALRDMKAEAKKRIRDRKRIKAGLIGKALHMSRPRGVTTIDGNEWALKVRGGAVSLTAYPIRQTAKGVSVEVNRGKRTLIKGAFIATMKSGHRGVFVRKDKQRLPIRELFGSRPVDALLHKGEADAVQARGLASMTATFGRLLPLELDKLKGGGG